ncbi:hypothetical protein ACI3QN_12745, partial [Propionibacterium freudenreichii]|uniref:hypothetical protein n=1 Tax=Propionibacterium freudenreichii TaxID=1744 RepID=UPI00385325AD
VAALVLSAVLLAPDVATVLYWTWGASRRLLPFVIALWLRGSALRHDDHGAATSGRERADVVGDQTHRSEKDG